MALSLLTAGIAAAEAVDLDDASDNVSVIRSASVKPGQKIVLDGKVVGVSPQSVYVPCGSHSLRLGRRRAEVIAIPCGGEFILGTPNRSVPRDRDAGTPDAAVDPSSTNDGGVEAAPPATTPADAGAPPEPENTSPVAQSVPAALGGRVFPYVRVPLGSGLGDTPIQQVSASIWVETKPRLNQWSSAAATVSLDAMRSSVDTETSLRARVREAYIDAYRGGFEMRIGQQIIPWGNADIYNPTDFLSAKDYAFFAADNEVRRLGALDVWLSLTPEGGNSPFQFIVVWAPVFTGSRFLVPAGLLPPGVSNAGVIAPPMTLDNSELAARISYKGENWDLALVGFRGQNHDPQFYLVSHDATSTVIAQTYRPILAAGMEASVSAGNWVFRAEGAYVSTENALAHNPALQPAHVDGVVGIERPFLERFRVQAQGIVRYFPVHQAVVTAAPNPDPVLFAIGQSIAAANAILLNYQERALPAATLRISFVSEGEKFEAEALAVMNFAVDGRDRNNFLLRPMLTYRWTDALRFHVGAESFGGPRDTPLGALRPFSGAFLGGDYRF